jgi:hypothetical protein
MLLKRMLWVGALVAAAATAMGAAAASKPVPNLTAAQVVDANVKARGGLAAWHAVKTLAISGHMDAGGKQNMQLPFVLKMQRPRMTRLELQVNGATAVQTYDGAKGWKLRPYLGRDDVEPFSPDELRIAADAPDLDGLLIDASAKGNRVALAGVEPVEGHMAYKLAVTLPNGDVRSDWVDAESFLEVKMQGAPKRLDGKMRRVYVYSRDYRTVDGIKIPYVYETVVEGFNPPHKMAVDKAAVNPAFEASTFVKPQVLAAQLAGK